MLWEQVLWESVHIIVINTLQNNNRQWGINKSLNIASGYVAHLCDKSPVATGLLSRVRFVQGLHNCKPPKLARPAAVLRMRTK